MPAGCSKRQEAKTSVQEKPPEVTVKKEEKCIKNIKVKFNASKSEIIHRLCR